MTFQCYNLLRKLKRAQMAEDCEVYVDFEELTAKTVVDSTETFVIVNLDSFRKSIHSAIQALENLGCIEQHSRNPYCCYLSLTSNGWHIWEHWNQKFLSFILQSILVPIIVAIITAIITSIITINTMK